MRNSQRAAPTNTNGLVFAFFIFVLEPNSQYLMRHFRNGWHAPNDNPPPPSRGGYAGRGPSYSNGFGNRQGRGDHSGGWDSHSNHGGYSSRTERDVPGQGRWVDGKHIVGSRNERLEKELFGDAADPSKQHTGINFEKYDDIPVEATGAGVPDPVNQFTNPPLDPVLLENISMSRYTTPTPVQKYSIPIVAEKRDLMACAQVSLEKSHSILIINIFCIAF